MKKNLLPSASSTRKLTILVAVHVFWIGMVCLLGAWWVKLVLTQAGRIAELEVAAGLATSEAHHQWERTQRMLYWESSTFFVLLLISTALIFWFYWRDMLRARSIQAFFASVTHELRTPLTSIRLQAESIAEGLSEQSSERHLIARMMEDTMRLEAQVERTLELARVEGGGPVYLQPLQLKPWLDRMIQGWRDAYAGRAEILAEIQDVTIEADPTALQVILKNLMENSVRHSRKEKVRVKIRTEISQNSASLVFEDDGDGFKGNARKLGELFHRGSSSQGTGVGLYLVQVLMSRMGGKADFAQQAGRGFRVALGFGGEISHG